MSAEPDQVDQFVQWIRDQVAEDPGFLPRVRESIAGAAFSPKTRERLDVELERLERLLHPSDT